MAAYDACVEVDSTRNPGSSLKSWKTKGTKLAKLIAEDIALASPETEVRTHLPPMQDPWDFEEVYAALHDCARAYPFNAETEDHLIHITTGTHVAQI